MKELLTHIKPSVAIVKQMEFAKQTAFVGSFHLYGGQKVYEMNIKTGEVCEAEFKEWEIKLGELGTSLSKKVIAKENCLYTAAINKNTAARKIIKAIANANGR